MLLTSVILDVLPVVPGRVKQHKNLSTQTLKCSLYLNSTSFHIAGAGCKNAYSAICLREKGLCFSPFAIFKMYNNVKLKYLYKAASKASL